MRFPKLSALALAATLAFPAFAGSAFNGYAITNTGAGMVNTFFDTDTATVNADWTAGLADLIQGSNLWLGGEVGTYPNAAEGSSLAIIPGGSTEAQIAALRAAGARDSYDFVRMAYTIDGGANHNLTLALNSSPGNNDKWQTLATAGVEVGSMLSVGAHTINVRFNALDNDGNSPLSTLDNAGNGWTTNFNVVAAPVPEPASGALILAGLGMIGVMAKRRRVVG